MMMTRFLRKTAFRMFRRDLARFLEEHEAELLRIWAEELHKVDERIPEEQMFIDIRMVELGKELLRAMLSGTKRFLNESPAK